MNPRGRRTAACLIFALMAAVPLVAQQPDTTRRAADTTRVARDTSRAAADTSYAVIFSEDIMSNAPQFVTLSNHTAYRVDVIPGGVLTIELRYTGAAPLVLHSMENPAFAEGGQSYVVTPTVTGEYRLTLYYTGTPTHVRIVRDPHELALLQGRAKPSLAMMTLSARAVYLTGARTLGYTATGADQLRDASVTAWELCLGLERGRFPGMPGLGGCLMTFGRYFQSGNGPVLQMVGTSPSLLLHRGWLGAEVSGTPVLVFGRASQNGRTDVSYWIVGGGIDAGWRLGSTPALEAVLSPGVVLVHQGGFNIPGPPAHDSPAHDALAVRLAAGLYVHL